MRILIKTENAAKAAKDVRLSLSEAVKVCIKKKEGVALGQFITCEGNSQTHTPFYCELDEEQAEFIAGSEFLGTIATMADMGETIEIIKEDDNCIEVSCGGSNVSLPLKKSMKLLQMKEDPETVTVKMDVVEFKNAILYGGYCPSKDNALGLKNTIELKFDFGGEEIQGAEQVLHVQTTDSYKGTKIQAPIKRSVQKVDGKQKKAEGERVYALDCAKIKIMSTMLQGDEVDMFLNKGQAIFINASRIFMFRAFEKGYPDISVLFSYKQSSVQIEVDSADVKRAADLIGIVCNTEESPVVLALEKDKLHLSDVKGKSENRIPAKINGKLKEKIGLKKENLIVGLMNASSEKIRIFIGGSDKPIFITGDKHDGTYFMVPVGLPSEHLKTVNERSKKN